MKFLPIILNLKIKIRLNEIFSKNASERLTIGLFPIKINFNRIL